MCPFEKWSCPFESALQDFELAGESVPYGAVLILRRRISKPRVSGYSGNHGG